MGFIKAEELFAKGQLDEALSAIKQDEDISINAKLLMGLILGYKGQFRDALNLADQVFKENLSVKDPIIEFKARILKTLPLIMFMRWGEAFTEINKAERIVDNQNQTVHDNEKTWIAELKLAKGLLTELLFGKRELAIQIEQQANEIFTEVGDFRGATRALINISMVLFFEGLVEESMNMAEKSLALSEKNEIIHEKALSLSRIGECYFSVGKLEAALIVLQKGVKIASKIENRWLEGELRLTLGKVYYRQGEFQRSQLELQQSLQMGEEVGDPHLSAKSILNLGDLLQVKGDIQGAIENFHKAFRIFRGLKDSNCSIDTNLKLGKAYMILGELDLAYQQFQNSFTYRLWNRDDNRPTNDIPLHLYAYPETLFQLVLVTLELELFEQAQQYLQRLEKFHVREPNTLTQFQVRLAKALVLKQSTRIIKKTQAQQILRELSTEKIVDHGLTVFAILNYCGMLVAELKFYGEKEVLDELEALFQKLIDLGQNTNAPILEIEALLLSSQVSLIEGKADNAIALLNQAQITAKEEGLSFLLPKIIQQQESLDAEKRKGLDYADRTINLKERLEGVQLQAHLIDTMKSSLIQDLGSQVFPISRFHEKKYQLIYRNFLQEQESIQKNKCRVGVAQIGLSTTEDLLGEFYEEFQPGLFSLKEEKMGTISSKVKKIAEEARSKGVNILLFPELSIDLNHGQLLDEILFYAKEFQMYIIPGSFHKKDTNQNVSVVITPQGTLWEQEKHTPAIITYEGQRFTEGIDVGTIPRRTIIGDTEYGRIAIVICRDFLDMDLRVEMKNFEPPIDLIFNLAFTPVTADFRAAHFDARRSIYAYCFFANVAEFGDSLIYTPEKDRIERTLPLGEEGLIYKDVDLFELRSERKKWEKKRESEKPFIQSTR